MINSMILGVTFVDWISTWYHIVAMVLIVLGIALYVLAKRLTIVVKKNAEIQPNDKMVATIRIIGLIIFIAGLILFCLPPKGFE